VRIEEAHYPGHTGEATVHNSFRDLREDLEEHDDAERGGRIIARLAWLIQNNAICLFQRGGVVAVAEERGKKIEYEVRSDFVDGFPDGVGGLVRAGGR